MLQTMFTCPEIEILINPSEGGKLGEIRTENGKKGKYFIFYDGEPVTGKINLTFKKAGERCTHKGIKVDFIGEIELLQERGGRAEFINLSKELAEPGELTSNMSYDFSFLNVQKPYESYFGTNVRLRYYIRVVILKQVRSSPSKEMDILVHSLCTYPDSKNPIKMEVGIEECLHIEFEYNNSKYHLKDVIIGKIYFLLVRIKIKHMEIAILKRESTCVNQNTYNENETLTKYEIMDGAPVRGESIPIRLFLAGYDLTPTMQDINRKFSVRYFLNLVLVDEEDRRYFKQQEIILWRKGEKPRKTQTPSQLQNDTKN